MITFVNNLDGVYMQPLPNGWVWAYVGIFLAVTIGFYALRSIGLMVMAKRAGETKPFLAWIPFMWIYVACKLIGEDSKFFGVSFRKLAIWFCIIFAFGEILTLASSAIALFPVAGNFLMGRNIYILSFTTDLEAESFINTERLTATFISGVYGGRDFVNPYGGSIYSIVKVLNVISYVTLITDIAGIVISVAVFFSLFKKYSPRNYMLFGILSLLVGIFGPLVFGIRKRQPVNYMDYVRSRYNYGPYRNPYGNPYAGQGSGSAQSSVGDPFEEFKDKNDDPGDPFDEFK